MCPRPCVGFMLSGSLLLAKLIGCGRLTAVVADANHDTFRSFAGPHAALSKPEYSDVAHRFWLDLADSRERRLVYKGWASKNTVAWTPAELLSMGSRPTLPCCQEILHEGRLLHPIQTCLHCFLPAEPLIHACMVLMGTRHDCRRLAPPPLAIAWIWRR